MKHVFLLIMLIAFVGCKEESVNTLSQQEEIRVNATLSWIPPTEYTDGTPLTDLTGYIIYYGTDSGDYENTIKISNPGISSYIVEGLISEKSYYFAITAFTLSGKESKPSNEASKKL